MQVGSPPIPPTVATVAPPPSAGVRRRKKEKEDTDDDDDDDDDDDNDNDNSRALILAMVRSSLLTAAVALLGRLSESTGIIPESTNAPAYHQLDAAAAAPAAATATATATATAAATAAACPRHSLTARYQTAAFTR
uniref:Uncharacterized protein n=1 Tax=Vespula pensylvanica TaxID=30213 RepID=A0A834JQH5_VESPE|nr:hypothetical protein H0235_017244 [Vespula pensylvanica]